ncbi:hypothetical protein evm_003743 [Chilo suppressalis]|nr:hypothetical protein evm_003743 [Chilo suppressalis]
MSDMIINDSVPVDKKWNELIKYNIFIMKLVEFIIALIITILPGYIIGSGTATLYSTARCGACGRMAMPGGGSDTHAVIAYHGAICCGPGTI